ncbi:MAG: hypothetical protein ACKO6L_11340 [Flavobacteriales bacterium]
MKYFLRFVFIVIATFIGGLVNLGLVYFGYAIVPLPEGFDMNDENQFALAVSQFQPINYLFPFLAHFMGSLVASYIATRALGTKTAWVLPSGLFLIGGMQMIQRVPSPMWFNAVDLGLAYFPAGYMGYLMARNSRWKAFEALDSQLT